jgi:hypothetical protein
MSAAFDVHIEWLDAPGVITPELAATWARYEIWVRDRCITQVEAADGTFRRSVYGSLYPLAQWIASNWWLLTSHVRPSAVETRYWTWQNVRSYPWLAHHNLRGAGDGMAWPDVTVVVEGAITRIVWVPDYHHHFAPVRFASAGSRMVPTEEMQDGVARIVNHVLERLAEAGLPKTQLAEEWAAIGKADGEEQIFCRTVARMGLDPYSVSDQTADDVVSIATDLPDEVAEDFFDSADPTALAGAAEWTRRAMSVADRAAAKAAKTLHPLYRAVSPSTPTSFGAVDVGVDRPWTLGYAMARRLRHELNIKDTDQFDASPWVGLGDVSVPSSGIQGFATVRNDRCGLVLDGRRLGVLASRFGQARALGRALARPKQQRFLLSAARAHDERVAGAFAAELLAPAEGIRLSLDAIGKDDDSALEAIARHFRVSPLLVRHQYDNQIAVSSHRDAWYF